MNSFECQNEREVLKRCRDVCGQNDSTVKVLPMEDVDQQRINQIILKLTLPKVCLNVGNPGAEYIGKEKNQSYFLIYLIFQSYFNLYSALMMCPWITEDQSEIILQNIFEIVQKKSVIQKIAILKQDEPTSINYWSSKILLFIIRETQF